MLSAFQSYGINPGPQLLTTQPDLVWGLIASLYIGNVMLLVLNLPLVGLWVKLLRIPRPILYAGILVFATLGAYSLHQSWIDLAMLYVFGLLGYAMRRWDIPVGPAVIGLILGPLAETQFRRALSISQAGYNTLMESMRAGCRIVAAPWDGRRGGVVAGRMRTLATCSSRANSACSAKRCWRQSASAEARCVLASSTRRRTRSCSRQEQGRAAPAPPCSPATTSRPPAPRTSPSAPPIPPAPAAASSASTACPPSAPASDPPTSNNCSANSSSVEESLLQ